MAYTLFIEDCDLKQKSNSTPQTMNDRLEPDFAMLQKASQARQNCEEKENRLKKKRNILLIIFLLCSTITAGLKISTSSLGLSEQLKLIAEHYVLWLATAISIVILASVIYFIFNLMSAHSETEKARKNEWKLLLYLNKQLSAKAV